MDLYRLMSVVPGEWLVGSAPPLGGLPSGGGGGGGGGAGGGAGAGTGGGAPAGGSGLEFLLPLMLGFFLLMIVMQVMSGRKEKKRRAEMMTGLRKHDRVRMLGGIIGTVAEIHDDELVVKVDESTNTRIRFSKDAVQTVLRAAPGGAGGEAEVAGG
ncbi:MAG: preprotein translocase subunit YajC [Phycisphaerales bacterium]